MATGFVCHELYTWHENGNFAGFMPLQPHQDALTQSSGTLGGKTLAWLGEPAKIKTVSRIGTIGLKRFFWTVMPR